MDPKYRLGDTDTEQPEARELVDSYRSAQNTRSPYEHDWRRVAELGMPREYGKWQSDGQGTPNAARTARAAQFDSTLGRSIPKFAAICERLVTPPAQRWHNLVPSNKQLMRSRAVKEYYFAYTELLFQLRYDPFARFAATQGQCYQSFGAFGNAVKMITWRKAPLNRDKGASRQGRYAHLGGFLYRNIAFADAYWTVDEDEQPSTFYRRIRWNAQQALSALKERCPKIIRQDAENKRINELTKTYEFFQCIRPSQEYTDGTGFDYRRFPLTSVYVFADKPMIVADPAGYMTNPVQTPRHFNEGGSAYGYGPGQIVLSTSGTANAQLKTMLKVGQKKADPPLLARDDGVMNGTVDIRPAAINYGGIDAQGRKMIAALDVGDLNMAEKLHERQQYDIEDAFFVTLFKIMQDRPQLTATQVLDEAAREAALVSPTMGLLQAEDLGPSIQREMDLCEQNGIAPPRPAEVHEDPSYDAVYTSPMAKAARAENVRGFVELWDMAANHAKATNDPSALRMLNFKRALPEIADQRNVPPSWINTPEEVAAEEGKAQDTANRQQMVDALPAVASIARTAATTKVPGQ